MEATTLQSLVAGLMLGAHGHFVFIQVAKKATTANYIHQNLSSSYIGTHDTGIRSFKLTIMAKKSCEGSGMDVI